MACALQAPLLAYFLRVDPEQGVELVNQALAARGPDDTRCYDSLLDDVARLYMCPELERIAIAALSDPNIEMVAHAATLLGQYGSAAAEEHLWRRFEEWHQQWQGREADLRKKLPGVTSLGAPSLADQALVENAFRVALSHSPAWLADLEELKRIHLLSLTENGRREAENLLKGWNTMIQIAFNAVDGNPDTFFVAQYRPASLTALKEKLAQFPPGTTFTWASGNKDGKNEQQLFAEIKGFLEERGMKLQRSREMSSR